MGRESNLVRRIGNVSVKPSPADRRPASVRRFTSSKLAMLDKAEKTLDLMAALKAAVSFEAELTPELVARLRAERVAADLKARQIVREVSYAGDEGGILCHVEPEGLGKRLLVSFDIRRGGGAHRSKFET